MMTDSSGCVAETNKHCKAIILQLKKKETQHRELSSVLCDDLEEGGEWWEGGSRGTGFMYTYG